MFESGYYPTGAENDPRAPWNQVDTEPTNVDVEITSSLHKVVDTEINNYIPGEIYRDEEGSLCSDGDDFSDTDWYEEYTESHLTPKQLIDILYQVALDLQEKKVPDFPTAGRWYKLGWDYIAKECQGWEEEENDVYKG